MTLSKLPDFNSVDLPALVESIRSNITTLKEMITAFCEVEKPTFNEHLLPILEKEAESAPKVGLISTLYNSKNSPEVTQAIQELMKIFQEHSAWQMARPEIHAALGRILENDNSLDEWQTSNVKLGMRPFEDMGLDRSPEDQKKISDIRMRLSELSVQFSTNLQKTDAAWFMELEEKHLEDLPAQHQATLRDCGERHKSSTGIAVDLLAPSSEAVMSYCKDREVRKAVWMQRNMRGQADGPGGPEHDNIPIILETLKLRKELAELYGFEDFASLALRHRMAKEPYAVFEMLHGLRDRLPEQQKREWSELETFAAGMGIDEVMPWDVAFVSQKQRQNLLGFTAAEFSNYMPVERVLEGSFELASHLFGVKFKEVDVSKWEPSVKFYEMWEGEECLGGMYVDMYARPGKQQGAWKSTIVARLGENAPVASLNLNAAPPSGDRPATLSHTGVVTVLHELGHVLHLLFGRSPYPDVDMSAVERDAIECPSQWMERFAYDKEFLTKVSSHIETGEKVPGEWIDAIRNSRAFGAGMFLSRQINFGLMDMTLHGKDVPTTAEELWDKVNAIRDETIIKKMPEGIQDGQMSSFSHIFAGGYSAGYYGYLWADVLSADAFLQCAQEASTDNTDNSMRFRKEILETGAKRPFMESYQAFRGQAPAVEALLQDYGLVPSTDKKKVMTP